MAGKHRMGLTCFFKENQDFSTGPHYLSVRFGSLDCQYIDTGNTWLRHLKLDAIFGEISAAYESDNTLYWISVADALSDMDGFDEEDQKVFKAIVNSLKASMINYLTFKLVKAVQKHCPRLR
jgi:hypothetical protein